MATATPYISGLKKPLNMLENPIYPDIKKAPPRFVWSRKHWNVDVGATMRDTEQITQFYEPAVLAQSRDYNKTVYGQSSHKDIVNAEFRPPLLSPYEDLGPITRIPATIHAIIPHINPGTAGHDGGTSGYTAKNERASDVEGALTDRIKAGEWRSTFFAPMEIPMDNSVLPDLEAKLPSVSVHAGWKYPVQFSPPPPSEQGSSSTLEYEKLSTPIHSGYTTQLQIDGQSGIESLSLDDNMPQVSITAGMNTPTQIDAETPIEMFELKDNMPQISVTAGTNTPIQIDAETRVDELFYNRPQVAATSGINNPIQIDGETRLEDIELETKISEGSPTVLNPGSEFGYKERLGMYSKPDDYIRDNRPIYSYVVQSESPAYKAQNEMTHRPHFRERLQPLKSYGQISQSSGAIPRSGIEQPRISLHGEQGLAGMPKPAKYRF